CVASGIWFAVGFTGALVSRKTGAAIYVESLAGSVSAVFGSQWGRETLYSGLAQGLGVEIVFAIFLCRRFSFTVAVLGGIGSALGAFVLELFTSANIAKSLEFNLIYLSCLIVSGVVLSGALVFFVF